VSASSDLKTLSVHRTYKMDGTVAELLLTNAMICAAMQCSLKGTALDVVMSLSKDLSNQMDIMSPAHHPFCLDIGKDPSQQPWFRHNPDCPW